MTILVVGFVLAIYGVHTGMKKPNANNEYRLFPVAFTGFDHLTQGRRSM
jgi:hypothetical protein